MHYCKHFFVYTFYFQFQVSFENAAIVTRRGSLMFSYENRNKVNEGETNICYWKFQEKALLHFKNAFHSSLIVSSNKGTIMMHRVFPTGGDGGDPPMYACPPKNFLKKFPPPLSPQGPRKIRGGSPHFRGNNFFKCGGWGEFKFHLLCCKVIRQFLECLFNVLSFAI